ncbi:nucleotidyltransferase domain-containing protein [Candidatus Micrarchaeota archaeon]|nr:nucleotidyltransferase domain-containing protein [Candidatus Micrarchaeota archaeon]MBI5176726.1 nucleotidyltransferase domain-containing protein [Candidatus Micrarchaeota archaeon]
MNDAFKKLNSPSALSLLEFFCTHPSRSFYVREAAAASGLSVGSCNAGLKLLAQMGLLVRSERGNQVHYLLNSSSPPVRQFRIFLSVLALCGMVDSLEGHCERIVLYGSRAFGEESEGSDFDVFILTAQAGEVKRILAARKFKGLSPLVADGRRLMALRTGEKPFYERIMAGIELWRRKD